MKVELMEKVRLEGNLMVTLWKLGLGESPYSEEDSSFFCCAECDGGWSDWDEDEDG
jgi:hypothetical protein